MKKVLFIFSILLTIGTGCSSSSEEEIKEAVKKVLYDNIEYAENEDIEGYMSTILKEGNEELYNNTEAQMVSAFEVFDLDYEIEKVEFEDVTEDKVVVRVVQTTKKVSGGEFKDNRIEAKHTLVKTEDGTYKFIGSELTNIEYLDSK